MRICILFKCYIILDLNNIPLYIYMWEKYASNFIKGISINISKNIKIEYLIRICRTILEVL